MQVGTYPTRNFALDSPCRHEARTISSARCRTELVGVWPLRIPGTETAPAGSSALLQRRSGGGRPRGDALRLHHLQDGGERLEAARFAVTSGYASKNGTTTSTSSSPRFTEKRRSEWRWLSWRRFSMIWPHPNTCWRSSSAGLDGAAWVTELVLDLPAEEAPAIAHDRDRETAFTVDEADDPLLESWPFLLIARTGRLSRP